MAATETSISNNEEHASPIYAWPAREAARWLSGREMALGPQAGARDEPNETADATRRRTEKSEPAEVRTRNGTRDAIWNTTAIQVSNAKCLKMKKMKKTVILIAKRKICCVALYIQYSCIAERNSEGTLSRECENSRMRAPGAFCNSPADQRLKTLDSRLLR